MEFNIQQKISNFVENQFPQFYQEEGPYFIQFVKAYYEWMEESGNPIHEARQLLNYRDIDNTLEEFLEHFQKKYLYGIPFDVIINKRYLLKHILDVYRSKSSIQGYRLLFSLIYDEDIEIYLPGRDMIRASDGTWKQPRYLELSQNDYIANAVGKEVVGVFSGTRAVAENYIRESFNTTKINTLYLSNIRPKEGNFEIGERIVVAGQESNVTAINQAPTILGSLSSIDIINGGQNFKVGDIIKIASNDLDTRENIAHGSEGLLKIASVSRGVGSLFYTIEDGSFGYSSNSLVWTYKNDATGNGASFSIGSLSNIRSITYNTDLILDYMSLPLNSASFGFTGNSGANLAANLGIVLSYSNNNFGTISTLSTIRTGNGYTTAANVFVRSTLLSKTLPGNVSYTNSSPTVTGTGTTFTNYFVNGDVIQIQANVSLSNTIENHVVKTVTNSTSLILWGNPVYNSVAGAKHKIAPSVLKSNFSPTSNIMYNTIGEVYGETEFISAYPSQVSNVANSAFSISSGKGYLDGETIKAYLYGAVSNNILILNPGNNYTNGDLLIFAGDFGTAANGYISTNSIGSITSAVLVYAGSGYNELPIIRVKSNTGTGAVLTSTLEEFNPSTEIIGKVNKSGIGKAKGYWTTTRGWLNSDKYITDSYYYQDFSYEIRVAQPLSKYREILYNTFHTAGAEIFGQYLLVNKNSSNISILYEDTSANIG